MNTLPVCLCNMCDRVPETFDSQELELQIVMRYHVGAGNQT